MTLKRDCSLLTNLSMSNLKATSMMGASLYLMRTDGIFCGILQAADEGIANIIMRLQERNLLDNIFIHHGQWRPNCMR